MLRTYETLVGVRRDCSVVNATATTRVNDTIEYVMKQSVRVTDI